MCSTALIDTGKMNGLAHVICASSFFILTLFAQVYNTVVVSRIQGKTQAFSQINLYVKYAIAVAMFFQIIGNFSVEGSLPGSGGDGNNKGNFYEWALTGTIISMFLSIGMDSNRFNFEYIETRPETTLEL